MKKPAADMNGLSEIASAFLVIILVLALAIVIYVMVSGFADPKYMKKTVYVAGDAAIIPIGTGSSPDYVLTYLAKAGDPFYLTGQLKGNGTQVTLRLNSPDGRNITPDTSGISGLLYGKTLYIYQRDQGNACDYVITETRPDPGLPIMTNGPWKVQMIDEEVHVLANTYTEEFTEGTTSLPVTYLLGTGSGAVSYRADCSEANGTCGGFCPLIFNTSPCNRTFARLTGSNYLTFPDDPTLTYTGDMAISVSIRPTATGNSNDPGTWHQIMGKGQLDASNNEIDNYQLFQIGDKLVFEWNDRDNPSVHYQAITTTSPLVANDWNDITVSVTNGVLTLYNNGVPQDLVYSRGVDPRSITTPVPNPPVVNLLNNNNAVTIGKQNGPGASSYFYFNGDIGGISLFNRGLTAAEVSARMCSE
jgi:hypothetical protein